MIVKYLEHARREVRVEGRPILQGEAQPSQGYFDYEESRYCVTHSLVHQIRNIQEGCSCLTFLSLLQASGIRFENQNLVSIRRQI